MLNVLITVDTEVWPYTPYWRETQLGEEMDCYIWGSTSKGSFGLPYQTALLREHGLRAVFFVESLFACVVGMERLQQIVEILRGSGQEVQLHIHTEWLERMEASPLGTHFGPNMKDFSAAEQQVLIALGRENLARCGVTGRRAFRAGNFGANHDTLRALSACGMQMDTSHNIAFIGSGCAIEVDPLLVQPRRLHGIEEYPVSYFRDFPGHWRPAQLCACSSAELEAALLEAWEQGWHSFVIVSHSFELLQRERRPGKKPRPARIVIDRFQNLCRFLARHSDKFRTVGFSDIAPPDWSLADQAKPLRSQVTRTARRMVEQAIGRLW